MIYYWKEIYQYTFYRYVRIETWKWWNISGCKDSRIKKVGMDQYPNDQIISLRPKRRGQQKKFARITPLIARYPK